MSAIFIAGATGFTGRALASLPQDHNAPLVLQTRNEARAKEVFPGDARTRSVEVRDLFELTKALEGCTKVVQLIGTVRKKFDAQTSYESVDYQSTLELLSAAKRKGNIDHFLLVSSAGAGLGIGDYLTWKKRTEAAVIESGLPYTIVRPGLIAGTEAFDERPQYKGIGAFLHGLAETPFGGPAGDIRPMSNELLAHLLLYIVKGEARERVVRGRGLWQIARKRGFSGAIKNHNLFDGMD